MLMNKVKKGFYFYDGKKAPQKIANNMIDFLSKLANDKINVGFNNQDILDQINYCLDNGFMKDIQKTTLNYYHIYMNPKFELFQKLNIYKYDQDANANLN